MKKIEDRFLQQKTLMGSSAQNKESVGLKLNSTLSICDDSLRQVENITGVFFDEFEENQNNFFKTVPSSVSVSIEEVETLIFDLRSAWDASKLDHIFMQCRKQVISSIVGPLGLGAIYSAYDKTGGNVNTIHNVRDDVYATMDEKAKYDDRVKYDKDEYHADINYKDKNCVISEKKKQGELVDSYTGKLVKRNSKTDLDHVVSAKEIHDDPGRILAEVGGVELANTTTNLKATDSSINRSKKAKSVDDYLDYLKNTSEIRSARIEVLSSKLSLTDKERKELAKLMKQNSVDSNLMKELDQTSRAAIDRIINMEYYTSIKFVKSVALTSSVESGKMGLQQSIGLLLTDLFEAILFEIKDCYSCSFISGVKSDFFFEALSIRCSRISSQVLADWKSVVSAFRDGAIGGFVSNLITTIINTFCTTAKNIVRMIREGFFSILEALKTLFIRPEGTTFLQSADAALKLMAVGVLTIGGFSLQEYLQINLSPFFSAVPVVGLYGDIIISIIGGSITAIATSLIVYTIDKLDFFGIHSDERHQYVLGMLRKKNATIEASIQDMFDSVQCI